MGWAGDLVNAVRDFFATDKDQKNIEVQRGRIATRYAESPFAASGPVYGALAQHLQIEGDLIKRYTDYEDMDDFPEISSGLDIFADDSTQVDSTRRKTVWIDSESEKIQDILNTLLHKQLRIEEDIWSCARTLAKYGDFYAEILLNEDGVVGLNFLPPPSMRRIEDARGALLGFIQDMTGSPQSIASFRELVTGGATKGAGANKGSGTQYGEPFRVPNGSGGSPNDLMKPVVFEPWEVVHWRLRGKQIRSLYGNSVMDPVRYIFRRLTLLEDASVLHRLTKAPGRFAFYINTGDLPPAQAMAYVDQIKNSYKKKKYTDANGNIDFKLNPLDIADDFWIPSREGTDQTRIEPLSGPDWQALDDVNYFRNKMFSGMKIPASYMGATGESSRSSLAQEDVRFARSVIRLQRELRNGLRRVCRTHLVAVGIDPDDVEWEVGMTVPSTIFELAQIEVRTGQAQLAAQMQDFFPKEWILTRVFGISDDEAKELSDALRDQQKSDAMAQAGMEADANEILGVPSPGEEAAANDLGADATAKQRQSAREAAKEKSRSALEAAREKRDQKKIEAEAKKTQATAAESVKTLNLLREELHALSGKVDDLKRGAIVDRLSALKRK